MSRLTTAFFLAAGIAALRVWTLDWRLDVHRAPGTAEAAYRVSPLRWRRELYTPDAMPVLRKLWTAIWVFYVCAFFAFVSFVVSDSE
jgi:hypothetical protein